jgi:hypothetical protein
LTSQIIFTSTGLTEPLQCISAHRLCSMRDDIPEAIRRSANEPAKSSVSISLVAIGGLVAGAIAYSSADGKCRTLYRDTFSGCVVLGYTHPSLSRLSRNRTRSGLRSLCLCGSSHQRTRTHYSQWIHHHATDCGPVLPQNGGRCCCRWGSSRTHFRLSLRC